MENLSYCDNNLTLSNGTVFSSVTSLLVENRFGVNVFYRVAPGQFGGFGMSHIKLIKHLFLNVNKNTYGMFLLYSHVAQLVVSEGEAIMV